MIPLRSSEPHYTRPTATLAIIAVNVLVFLYELSLGMNSYALKRFIAALRHRAGSIALFVHPDFDVHPRRLPAHRRATCGSCGFSAAAWRIFWATQNICSCTLPAELPRALLFILLNSNSTVPTIGASGAIAGVMGAYLIKFPRAHIVTLVFIIIFITTIDIPAAFLLLYWFAIQFFSGVGSVGYSATSNGDVAWFAHVGGFLAGMALVCVDAHQAARAALAVLACGKK